jgi:hypothetical protein
MTNPSERLQSTSRTVLLIVTLLWAGACWWVYRFGLPDPAVLTDPSPKRIAILTLLCGLIALATAKLRWLAFIAAPAVVAFAAMCIAIISTRFRVPENYYSFPPPPSHAAFIVLCGLTPGCLLLGITLERLAWRRSRNVTLVLALWTAPIWAIGLVNTADYIAFRRILHRMRSLSPQQLAAIAQRARKETQEGRFSHRDWPVEYSPLHPAAVVVTPTYSYATLYHRGTYYIEFAVDTGQAGQSAYFFTNCDGVQKEVHLWPPRTNDPARPPPVVRLHEYTMHDAIDWIVLPRRIVVIGRKDDNPRADRGVVADADLSAEDQKEVAKIVAVTKARIGGRAFSAGVVDGRVMMIRFGPSESTASDDVLLDNAWTEAARPLVEAISRRLPAKFKVKFPEQIEAETRDWGDRARPIRVSPISETRDEHPKAPWWCLWPEVLRPAEGFLPTALSSTHVPDPYRYVFGDS